MEKLEKNYCIQYTQLHIVLQVTIWLHCKCKKSNTKRSRHATPST